MCLFYIITCYRSKLGTIFKQESSSTPPDMLTVQKHVLFVAKLLRKCTEESAIIHVIYVTQRSTTTHGRKTAAKAPTFPVSQLSSSTVSNGIVPTGSIPPFAPAHLH